MRKIITYLFFILLVFTGNKTFSQGLTINEFDYDQPGTDSAEFIELYNSSSNIIDLSGYSILFINGNGNSFYDTILLPSFNLNPNSFFVICGSYNFVPNCNMILNVPSNIIQNGSPDALAIIANGSSSIVDAVSYEGTVGAPYYETAGVPAPSESDSSLSNFQGLSRNPDGHDTNNNASDFHLRCITPGYANAADTNNCQQPLSASVLPENDRMRIYPNPSRGAVIMDFKGMNVNNGTITINNVLGKELKRFSLKGNVSFYHIDLSTFQDGIYYVNIKSDEGETTKRIILRKN